ncbi:hypothetical protein Tco_0629401 [Tanacetum coccineum]|uniref:Uncharacterized protein n=1 Tax=Tanacetum coccineum TaxID=301880 RepID=A0ABQ4WT22_9ASTR
MYGSSKGTKSQPKSSGKSVQSEEPVFKVADSDMPQDQEGNLGDNEDEPRKETASRRDWFKKPTPPQEPIDPDWHDFDELMSTRSNYVELEYDFEECYKALSEKLDWENPEGGDYPFDLSKPLPLITHGKRQRVPFEYFINNDLKYLQGGVSTMTYMTSTTKTKSAQYDLPGIEDKVPNIWSPVKVAYDKYTLWGISHWREQSKSFYAYARGRQSRGDVRIYQKRINFGKEKSYFMIKDIQQAAKGKIFPTLERALRPRLRRLYDSRRLIQKLCNDQKCMKKVVEDMSGSYEHKSNQCRDHRPNGDALKKCILEGPYTPTTVIIPAVPAMDNSPAVLKRTTVETVAIVVNKLRKVLQLKQQSTWTSIHDEEIDEQELEAHYIYMAKLQEVPNADSCTDSEH